jgi:hypothetical protein
LPQFWCDGLTASYHFRLIDEIGSTCGTGQDSPQNYWLLDHTSAMTISANFTTLTSQHSYCLHSCCLEVAENIDVGDAGCRSTPTIDIKFDIKFEFDITSLTSNVDAEYVGAE